MSIKEVRSFQTDDGQVFSDQQAAMRHALELELQVFARANAWSNMDKEEIAGMLYEKRETLWRILHHYTQACGSD